MNAFLLLKNTVTFGFACQKNTLSKPLELCADVLNRGEGIWLKKEVETAEREREELILGMFSV